MSSLVLSEVQAVPGFVLPAHDDQNVGDPVTIFTVPGAAPALIESVYMVLEYDALSAYGDTFVLRLRDRSGIALMAQPSSIQMAEDLGTFELTWMRRGNDTAIGGEFTWIGGVDEVGRSWFTGTLPDTVLAPLSTVELQAYRGGTTNPYPALPVSQVAVTYTPAGVGVAQTFDSGILPLLVPTTG